MHRSFKVVYLLGTMSSIRQRLFRSIPIFFLILAFIRFVHIETDHIYNFILSIYLQYEHKIYTHVQYKVAGVVDTNDSELYTQADVYIYEVQ